MCASDPGKTLQESNLPFSFINRPRPGFINIIVHLDRSTFTLRVLDDKGGALHSHFSTVSLVPPEFSLQFLHFSGVLIVG